MRIKQAPPVLSSESPDKVKDLVSKHNVPIKKQRVLLKPKKVKLPTAFNKLDDENFEDVLYDSDDDKKKQSAKKS